MKCTTVEVKVENETDDDFPRSHPSPVQVEEPQQE